MIFTQRPFILFAVIGFLISLAIFQLLLNWIAFFAIIYDKPNLGYHELPTVIHVLQAVLRWAVWLIPLLVFVVDFSKKMFTRTIGYVLGLALAMMVAIVLFMIQWGEVMAEF